MSAIADELKANLDFAARRLIQITGSYYGHVAVRLDKNSFALKYLRPPLDLNKDSNDPLVFDLSGKLVEGGREVPNEIPIYTEAFKASADWNSVIHVHPENAIVLGVAGIPLRALDQQSRWFFEPVPIYPSATSAETNEIGRELARLMQTNRAVAMRGHGIVVAGENLKEAFARAWLYERTARLTIQARALGEVTYLNDDDVRLSPPAKANTAEWLWAYLKWQERSESSPR